MTQVDFCRSLVASERLAKRINKFWEAKGHKTAAFACMDPAAKGPRNREVIIRGVQLNKYGWPRS
jgi:hypothetical protein